MKKLWNFLQLMWVGLAVRWWNFQEYGCVIFRYYRNLKFAKADLLLLAAYTFRNPYAISRRFLKARGEQNVHAYGETPLTTMAKIAEECGLGPNDTVFELGCGRGRTCFWLHYFRGCQVVGVDFVPTFIVIADWVKEKAQVDGVHFLCEDITQVDYSNATAVYLYGTGFDDATLKALMGKLKVLPKGAKIISVSYPLDEYCPDGMKLTVDKAFVLPFPWGNAHVYTHEISISS